VVSGVRPGLIFHWVTCTDLVCLCYIIGRTTNSMSSLVRRSENQGDPKCEKDMQLNTYDRV
jgi:hypothetical protein